MPLAEALVHLCSEGLAADLRASLRAVEKLAADEPDSAGADDLTEQVRADRAQRDRAAARARRSLAEVEAAIRADLRSRAKRGEFHLRGQRVAPEPVADDELIPYESFDELVFDSNAHAVRARDRSYANVRAVLGPESFAQHGRDAGRLLPLCEALIRWCDAATLLEIRRCEFFFSVGELRSFEHPHLGAAGGHPSSERNLGPNYQLLRQRLQHGWDALARDLKRRFGRKEVYLQGVQTRPELRTVHESIPSTWAPDVHFCPQEGTLTVDKYRYISVICSLDPPEPVATVPEPAPLLQTLTNRPLGPADIPALDDETILALLEEHARRAIAGPDAKLIAPGKISLIPIIKRKMEDRAAHRELLPKLADEAEVLFDWICSKVEHYAVPSASTIAKVLGKTYAVLLARSKAATQKPKV